MYTEKDYDSSTAAARTPSGEEVVFEIESIVVNGGAILFPKPGQSEKVLKVWPLKKGRKSIS